MKPFTAFFAWLSGVFEDPNDKQGSTKRLCLFLFLGTLMVLISIATFAEPVGVLPEIPESILELVFFVVSVLTGSLVADKGIAVWKHINNPSEPKGRENAEDAGK